MSDATSDRREERYIRWQKLAIEQLGIVINLFLTFAGAILAFAVKTMMESNEVLPAPASEEFHCSLIALGLSIGFALLGNVTRAFDFRYTRKAIRVLV